MCCRTGLKTTYGEEHSDSCIFAGHRRHFESSELPAAEEKYAMFLFDDSSRYIETVVKPLFQGDKINCLSYHWAKEFAQARRILIQFEKKRLRPDAFIFNMGSHEYNRPLERIQPFVRAFLKAGESYASSGPVQMLFHSATSVLYADHKRTEELNPIIQQYNSFVANLLSEARFIKYLDFWNYDISMSAVHGCKRDDGVHFERQCNYQPILVQWDFNWLAYMGVIVSY